MPEGLDKIFFVNSGSEAVDTAMKMALNYHRIRGQGNRQMFVSRERAYHGVNFGGVALSGMVNNRRAFGSALPSAASKVRSMPMTSPVDFISGPRYVSTPVSFDMENTGALIATRLREGNNPVS